MTNLGEVQEPHIVYVDDDKYSMAKVVSAFGELGVRITTFDDPSDALVHIRSEYKKIHPVQALLTDNNMGGLFGNDGAQLAARLMSDGALPPSHIGILSNGHIDDISNSVKRSLRTMRRANQEEITEPIGGVFSRGSETNLAVAFISLVATQPHEDELTITREDVEDALEGFPHGIAGEMTEQEDYDWKDSSGETIKKPGKTLAQIAQEIQEQKRSTLEGGTTANKEL